MTNLPNTPDDDTDEDFDLLLHAAVGQILREENPARFLRWFSESAPLIAPAFFRHAPPDPESLRSLLSVLGRDIWNKTPLPGNHFRPRPLPKPERNSPCPCGSGRKYKHCCASVEHLGSPFPNLSLLPYVLDTLTAKEREALPYAYLNPDEVAHVAEQWMEEGRAKDAAKLLEGLLADLSKLDERAEYAFDKLLDCYDILGNPLKKKKLLERGMGAPNKRLRAAAMQRRCCILSDRNEYPEAWALFQELQRLVPNDPSLSHLEITMLLGQGERQRAAERARFWMARLSRDPEFDYGPLIEFLRGVAQGDAASAMAGIIKNTSRSNEKLLSLIEHLPAPACHYTLEPMGDSAGPLQPNRKLQSLIAQWTAQSEYAQEMADDVDWLERNPLAWNCFEILDDWLENLENARASHGFEEVLLLPVLRHAEALLHTVLNRHQAEGLHFEWGWHENRPALNLMEQLVYLSRVVHDTATAARVAEWMVSTLNPNDNQGMRDGLIHDYLRLGRIKNALTLGERYPDDMAPMQYGMVLALFMDRQEQAALDALKVARKRYPEIAKMLLADKPKQPRLQDGLVRAGGKDEAWYYRQEQFDLWQNSGGLAWLRGAGAKPIATQV